VYDLTHSCVWHHDLSDQLPGAFLAHKCMAGRVYLYLGGEGFILLCQLPGAMIGRLPIWMIRMYATNFLYMWHDLFYMYATTHLHMWHASFIFMTRLICTCDTTLLYVWHDSILYVIWLIHLCDARSQLPGAVTGKYNRIRGNIRKPPFTLKGPDATKAFRKKLFFQQRPFSPSNKVSFFS